MRSGTKAGGRAEHLIIALLPIDQLELIKLHIVLLLLDKGVFLDDLFIEILNHVEIFWPGRSLLVEVLELQELLVEIIEFVVHEAGGVLELALHLFHVSGLLLNHPLHLLAQLFLEHLLPLVELLFDLFGPPMVLLETLLALNLGLVDSVVHTIYLRLLLLDHSLKFADLPLEVVDGLTQGGYLLVQLLLFGLEFLFSVLTLLFELFKHFCVVCLLFGDLLLM